MYIVGLAVTENEGAVSLLNEGEVVATARETRTPSQQFTPFFPENSFFNCLKKHNLAPDQIDFVGVSGGLAIKPWKRGMPKLHQASRLLAEGMFYNQWVKRKLEEFCGTHGPFVEYCDADKAGAADAFYGSGLSEAAVLSFNGASACSFWKASQEQFELSWQVPKAQSLTRLFGHLVVFSGFPGVRGAERFLSLADYGEPKYVEAMKSHLIQINDNGSFEINSDYFETPFAVLEELFQTGQRSAGSPISVRDIDIATSFGVIMDELVEKIAGAARTRMLTRNMCLSGHDPLVTALSHKLGYYFDRLWTAPQDAATALACGSSFVVYYQNLHQAASGFGQAPELEI